MLPWGGVGPSATAVVIEGVEDDLPEQIETGKE
jgi:hypothetical protein